jgi:phosphatidylglycerophosphate synthase
MTARSLPTSAGWPQVHVGARLAGMSVKRAESQSRRRDLPGLAADGLTLGRAVAAVALVPVFGAGQTALGAALVGSAWLSDFFDGRAARASPGPTSLGAFDLWADTLLGAGAVLGFTLLGWVPPMLGLGLVVLLLASFALTKNEAISMVLQASGYALVLWRTWRDGHTASLTWLIGIIVAIAIVNRRILMVRSLPTFFGGVAALVRRRPDA